MAEVGEGPFAPAQPHVLREYALLADGERGIVVDPDGDFVWMCFPRWDSDAVFASLIGSRGSYAITPLEPFVWGGHYEPGGLIWRSRWVTAGGSIIESREALAYPAAAHRAVVLRQVIARCGRAQLGVRLDVRDRYGEEPVRDLGLADGVWRGRTGRMRLFWTGAADAAVLSADRGEEMLYLALDLPEGASHDFVLVLDLAARAPGPPPAAEAWAATEAAWSEAVPRLDLPVADRDARHACAVVAGLTSTSGAMVAAATTSLPERAREGRSFDYRYAWIRDQCIVGQALARAACGQAYERSARWVAERLLEHGPTLRPAYTTAGTSVPNKRTLSRPGYPGGTDVVGNSATLQFQLDTFGEALLLFAAGVEGGDTELERAVEIAVSVIEARWQEPDAGIWELEPQHWTHSRLICAAGLRAVAARRPHARAAARWLALADAITAETAAVAVHPTGRWQRSPDDERVDVALLLPSVRSASLADPRSEATLDAVLRDLTEDGYVYRYRPDARPLGAAEGAFLLCGFVVSLALARRGDAVASARWFERNRAACGPPGLLAEEFDVAQRQLRGNLPQAFVHALLLDAAVEQATLGEARTGRRPTRPRTRRTLPGAR
jgi:alpha,alpha-trehalase